MCFYFVRIRWDVMLSRCSGKVDAVLAGMFGTAFGVAPDGGSGGRTWWTCVISFSLLFSLCVYQAHGVRIRVLVNETAVIRYDYNDPSLGSCEESVNGGNHFRYWVQNGPEANRFVRACVEGF